MSALQLPDDVCRDHERRPWTNRCPLSYETRCPDSTSWVSAHFASRAALSGSPSEGGDARETTATVVVYVGCNKGMDAVNALRMASNDPAIDKFRWRDAFFDNATAVQPGHCHQELDPQHPIVDPNAVREARAYCLEAMPVTAKHLANTAERLGWQDRFKVRHAAISNEPSWAWFPNPVDGKVGVEGLGMDVCSPKKRGASRATAEEQRKSCANVTVTTLDGLLANEPGHVDLLSIDVEGYDYNVLLGAKATLPRVRYVEFEYNWKKPWGSQSLREAMDYLESYGFVCYWAGHKQRVWRITKCWRDAYNRHFWSNVACVNGKDETVRPMANQLEQMFQDTLKHGAELAFQIDQDFRAFYTDVVDGYVKRGDGTLQFTRIK
jgi:FkbM family methyltransferase